MGVEFLLEVSPDGPIPENSGSEGAQDRGGGVGVANGMEHAVPASLRGSRSFLDQLHTPGYIRAFAKVVVFTNV